MIFMIKAFFLLSILFLVSYVVVGFSVLYSLKAKENLDSPEIASIMAQGSYACLYLINSFSSLLQSAESFSEIYGYNDQSTYGLEFSI